MLVMIGLVQRVTRANVRVEGRNVGEIGPGLVVLLCAERGDGERQAVQLMAKILALRIFADDAGKMNRNVADVRGGLLLVPQFTLAADTRSGNRPSFTPAAPPAEGRALFEHCVVLARAAHPIVATGEFGAMMQVELVNDGPATFWLRIEPDVALPAVKEVAQ
jgi:D-tyrosyl-tRNA(Tyr) deacylase